MSSRPTSAMRCPGSEAEPPSGPYRTRDIVSGEPYELSNGYKVHCMSQSGRSSQDEAGGVSAILSDPANRDTGVDTGYALSAKKLRAPDIAVGEIPDKPGWVKGVPQLAVEYADTGQNEDQLQAKIGEFLQLGTRYVWVVRLVGPRRVEVYTPGQRVKLVSEGEDLVAEGVLHNPVPVRALFDKDAALEVTLRNLLNRKGYAGLDAVRAEGNKEGQDEGQAKGLAEAVLRILRKRGVATAEAERQRILAERDPARLVGWVEHALDVSSAAELWG